MLNTTMPRAAMAAARSESNWREPSTQPPPWDDQDGGPAARAARRGDTGLLSPSAADHRRGRPGTSAAGWACAAAAVQTMAQTPTNCRRSRGPILCPAHAVSHTGPAHALHCGPSRPHSSINCKDVEITASWYQRVLGMEREEFGDHRTALKFGGQKINLRPSDTDTHKWITGANSMPGAVDACFITAVGPEDVVEHLHSCRRRDRGRAGKQDGCARRHPVGVLPRSGRQPDRDQLLSLTLRPARSGSTCRPGLIAQSPARPREAARLLAVGAGLADHTVADLPRLLERGDLLVANDTRVIPAQLSAHRGAGPHRPHAGPPPGRRHVARLGPQRPAGGTR